MLGRRVVLGEPARGLVVRVEAHPPLALTAFVRATLLRIHGRSVLAACRAPAYPQSTVTPAVRIRVWAWRSERGGSLRAG
jgi:hypothetical protein